MLDRIDIQIELPSLSYDEINTSGAKSESSAEIRARVCAAREFAAKRNTDGRKIFCNAQLTSADISKDCKTTPAASALLKAAYDRMGMSVRGYDRIMRVARTIVIELPFRAHIRPLRRLSISSLLREIERMLRLSSRVVHISSVCLQRVQSTTILAQRIHMSGIRQRPS